jgi:hypothetical protein
MGMVASQFCRTLLSPRGHSIFFFLSQAKDQISRRALTALLVSNGDLAPQKIENLFSSMWVLQVV